MTSAIPINVASQDEKEDVLATIVMAFASDPLMRWMYKTPGQYLKHFPEFIDLYAGNAFEKESAHYVGDFSGAALWLPPGVGMDEEKFIEYVQRTIDPTILEDFFGVFEIFQSHQIEEPHWHLPFIGVTPRYRGKGRGSAMMKRMTTLFDETQTVATLESSNPANLGIYLRHGFELITTIQVGSSPPFFLMVRKPQS